MTQRFTEDSPRSSALALRLGGGKASHYRLLAFAPGKSQRSYEQLSRRLFAVDEARRILDDGRFVFTMARG
jgi:hypothetical protein